MNSVTAQEGQDGLVGGGQHFTLTRSGMQVDFSFITSTIPKSATRIKSHGTSQSIPITDTSSHPTTEPHQPASFQPSPSATETHVSSERVAALTLEAQIAVIIGVIIGCVLAGLIGYAVSRCQGWRYLTKVDRNSRKAQKIRRSRENTGQGAPPMSETVHRMQPSISRRDSLVPPAPLPHDGNNSPGAKVTESVKLSRHNSLVPTPLFNENTITFDSWVAMTERYENGNSSSECRGSGDQALPTNTQSLPNKKDPRGSISQARSRSQQQSHSSSAPTVTPSEIENMAYQPSQMDGAYDDDIPDSRQASRHSNRRDLDFTLSSPPVTFGNQVSPKKHAPAHASLKRDTLEHMVRMELRNISSSQGSEYSQATNGRAISWANSVKGGAVAQQRASSLNGRAGLGNGVPVSRRDGSGSSVISVISDTELERLGVGQRVVNF